MTTLQKLDQELHKTAVQFAVGTLFSIGSGFLIMKTTGFRVFYAFGMFASPFVGFYLGRLAFNPQRIYEPKEELTDQQAKLQQCEEMIKYLEDTHGKPHEYKAEYIIKNFLG